MVLYTQWLGLRSQLPLTLDEGWGKTVCAKLSHLT